MSDIYTRLAQAARVNRDDVKRVLYAAAYDNTVEHSIEIDDPDSIAMVRISVRSPGSVELQFVDELGVTSRARISTRRIIQALKGALF